MSAPVKIAIAGIGRMGSIHLQHALELQRETRRCVVTAIVEPDAARVARLHEVLDFDVPVLASVEDLVHAGAAEATFLVTPTKLHREHAETLLAAGQRVLLEKPLTGDAASDRELSARLDRDHPDGVMLAFQRRFDPALEYARDLMKSGLVGRVFKICSALEDSGPPPDGYNSPGILSDMAIHNVDEVNWFAGATPRSALAIGARLFGHRISTCEEDFDDAMLCVWFGNDLMGQIQVSRNHVSGYRNETVIYGEKGQIHVGRFEQKAQEVVVESYGPRGKQQPLDSRTFAMRAYNRPVPEFADRFGPAYKAELAAFVECCRNGKPFPTTHRDAAAAQEAIAAGMRAVFTEAQAARCGTAEG